MKTEKSFDGFEELLTDESVASKETSIADIKEHHRILIYRIGKAFKEGGEHTGQIKHEKAQAEYAEIRKEYARVSLLMPSVTKKEKMRITAKHWNVSVSKVRDALREK